MLRTYFLSPETLRRMIRRAFWRFQFVVTATFLALCANFYLLGDPVNWNVAGPILIFLAFIYFLLIFINYQQQLRLLLSLRYEVDGNSISLRQIGHPTLSVFRADITAVNENDRGVQIYTANPRVHLLIPKGLSRNGDEDFHLTLIQWHPDRFTQSTTNRWLSRSLWIGVPIGLLIILFVNSLWLFWVAMVLVTGYTLFIEQLLMRALDTQPGYYRMVNLAFSFLFLIVIIKSCLMYFQLLVR